MKKSYNFHVTLRCPICGSDDIELSEDKSYGKCNMCGKEFYGGRDELIELNQATINDAVEEKKAEIQRDFEKEIHDKLKIAFKGSKFIKIK